jgi:glutamate-1-semialdehyde 2,1-aminomutase
MRFWSPDRKSEQKGKRMAVEVRSDRFTDAQAAVEQDVIADYRQRTPRSLALHESARRVMPGGDTRTVAFHAPYPLAIATGAGPRLWDADGNEYIDLLNNYTALIHGHAYPPVVEAVSRQLPNGSAFPAPNEAQTHLAEILTERVASVDLVRFCNSGSEAVMNAIRAARAFTGRDLIVKIEGGYHGTYDDVEVSVHPDPDSDVSGLDSAPVGVLGTQGVPGNTLENVDVVPLNDSAAVERLFAARGDQIAAVIIEPVMGSAGALPATSDFLDDLRALTIEHDALLIFDEVMSFRLGHGGYQQHVRVRPDLTCFAKIIGGGFPVGAFGGRAAIMEQFDPTRPTPLWQSGTFNGNLVTVIAGVAAMTGYDEPAVERANRLGDRLREGLGSVLRQHNVRAAVTGYGSMVGLHLGVERVTTYRDAARAKGDLGRLLHLSLLLDGVFCAPRLMWCTSTVMDDALIDEVLNRFERSVRRLLPVLAEA